MRYSGTMTVTYTNNGENIAGGLPVDIAYDITENVKEYVISQLTQPEYSHINTEELSYVADNPDYLTDIISENYQAPINLDPKNIEIGNDIYTATFGELTFEIQNNQEGGKYYKRKIMRRKIIRRKTHRKRISKRKTNRRRRN
jgi:hypothetical protein